VKKQYKKATDVLRGLGLDDFLKDVDARASAIKDNNERGRFIESNLLSGMAALCKPPEKGQPDTRPYFRFRTWKGQDQEIVQSGGKWLVKRGNTVLGSYRSEQEAKANHPFAGRESMINHEWNGVCDYQPHAGLPTEPTQVQDDSGSPLPQPSVNGADPTKADGDADGAVAELVTKANAGDDGAKRELDRLARAAGATADQIDGVQTWEEVAAFVTGNAPAENPPATSAEEEATAGASDTDEEPPPPAVGETYKYQLVGKEGLPRKARNGKELPPVECTVEAVNKANSTVDLNDGKNTYKDVAWDALLPLE